MKTPQSEPEEQSGREAERLKLFGGFHAAILRDYDDTWADGVAAALGELEAVMPLSQTDIERRNRTTFVKAPDATPLDLTFKHLTVVMQHLSAAMLELSKSPDKNIHLELRIAVAGVESVLRSVTSRALHAQQGRPK